MCTGLHVKYPLFLSHLNDTLSFSKDFRKTPKYQISWKFVQWESSCSMRTDGQTDGQTDKTKVTVAFSQFCGRADNSARPQNGLLHFLSFTRSHFHFRKITEYARTGQMHQRTRGYEQKITILQWHMWARFKVVVTHQLTFVTWGTLRIEHPLYVASEQYMISFLCTSTLYHLQRSTASKENRVIQPVKDERGTSWFINTEFWLKTKINLNYI
jgi:hypothetical protein